MIMATKKISVRDALKLNPVQIRNMDDKAIKQMIQTMADAANKRVRRLKEADFLFVHPAVREWNARLKKDPTAIPFQVQKGKMTRKAMRAEYERLKNFLNPDTTKSGNTVRGWRKVENKFIQEMGGDEAARKAVKSPRFWKLYRELEEMYNGQRVKGSRKKSYDSDQMIQNLIRDKYQRKLKHSDIKAENQEFIDQLEQTAMKERRNGTAQKGSKSKKFKDLT